MGVQRRVLFILGEIILFKRLVLAALLVVVFPFQGVLANDFYQKKSLEALRELKDRQAATQVAVLADDQASPCVIINSTKLRRLIIQGRIESGMMATDVKRAKGEPSYINRSSNGLDQWVYSDHYGSQYLYFRDGCLASWN